MPDEISIPPEIIATMQPKAAAVEEGTAELKETLSDAEIERILERLYMSGVLGGMRANVQSERTFFSPARGFVTERDESETGNVIDTFRDAISADEEEAIRNGLYTPQEVENMLVSLEPGSDSRRILLAYWNVNEKSPWSSTSDNICNRQSYKNKGFPSSYDISFVSDRL